MIAELQAMVSTAPLDAFYDEVLRRTGYLAALESKNSDESAARIENIQELKSSIVKFADSHEGGDLYSYLDEVALYTDMDTYDRGEDAAVLMTMHSAKGLEFPVVFLAGFEENLFPSPLSIGDSAEMEEERRLCYVAITRAKEKLYITCAAQRMLYGRTNANLPSRFTEEIPGELLDRQGTARREESRARSFWDDDGGFHSGADYRSSGFERNRFGGSPGAAGSRPARPQKKESAFRLSSPAAKTPGAAFASGDRIRHSAFGNGVIQKMTPMGGDALIEVAFDSGETRKMMLRIAAQHMEKL